MRFRLPGVKPPVIAPPPPRPVHVCRDTVADILYDLMARGWRPVLKTHTYPRRDGTGSHWVGWQLHAYPSDQRVRAALNGMLIGEVHDSVEDAVESTSRRARPYEELA